MLLPALGGVGDFPPEGVALPVVSEKAASKPTAVEEAVPLSPAEVPADAAFPPEPPSTRQQSLGDTLGRSDTKSLSLAEEFAFLSSSTGVIHVCSSAFAQLVVCDRTNLAFCTSYLRVLACASIGPVTWPCFLQSVSGILLLPVTKACRRWSGARAGCIYFCMLALSVAAICFCLLSAGK